MAEMDHDHLKAAALRERRRHCVILDSLFDESFVHLYYFDAVALAYPAGGSYRVHPGASVRARIHAVVVQFYTRHCAKGLYRQSYIAQTRLVGGIAVGKAHAEAGVLNIILWG